MTKKINARSNKIYRPYIPDDKREIRKEIEKIQKEFPHLNKQGLEKMIFLSGIPIVKKNLHAVNIRQNIEE